MNERGIMARLKGKAVVDGLVEALRPFAAMEPLKRSKKINAKTEAALVANIVRARKAMDTWDALVAQR